MKRVLNEQLGFPTFIVLKLTPAFWHIARRLQIQDKVTVLVIAMAWGQIAWQNLFQKSWC
jgi:hypothetical protein